MSQSSPAVRRKFYQEDLLKYFAVEFLENSVIDPDVVPLLKDYNIKDDPQFNDEQVERRIETYKPYFDRGFKEDRRIYAALSSPEIGYGAFAEVYIPAWTIVGEYTGTITDKKFNTDYAWIYHSTPKDKNGDPVRLRINARASGNLLRFINHSDYPNCSVLHVPYENRWRTVYITNRPILPDEELLVYYGDGYWEGRSKKNGAGV
jgi:SET domain-containing protein